MCKETRSVTSSDNKDIITYRKTDIVERGDSTYKIIHSYLDKNTDVTKNLRVGLYSNLTYFYNPLSWEFDAMTYKIKEQVDVSLGKTIGLPGGDIAEKFQPESWLELVIRVC